MEDKLVHTIEFIKNKIYYRLQPSSIHGVGLFAIKDIPEGTSINDEIDELEERIAIPKSKLKDVDGNILKLLNDYFVSDDDCYKFYFPINYKWMHNFFMNHSSNPNFDCVSGLTTRDIKEGEEITEDYSVLHDMYEHINYKGDIKDK